MSEENAAPDGTSAEAGQGQAAAPVMTVNAQYVKDLSFENPNAPKSLLGQEGEPNVQIAIDVNAEQVADKTFEVTLSMRAEGTSGESPLFIVEVAYAGIFSLGEMPDEYVPPMLYIEAPRQLFPFARAIVADAVRDGGFPPLLMQPIDFMSMYQQRVAQAQAGGQPGGGNGAGGEAEGGGKGDDGGGKPKFEFEL